MGVQRGRESTRVRSAVVRPTATIQRKNIKETERGTVEKSCKVLKSRKIEDSERAVEETGWTVRFLGSTCVPATKLAANGVTQLSHYWKLVTCTVPRAVTKAPPPPPAPSDRPCRRPCGLRYTTTRQKQLRRRRQIAPSQSTQARTPPHSTLYNFVLFGSTYLHGIFYPMLAILALPPRIISFCLPFASLSSSSQWRFSMALIRLTSAIKFLLPTLIEIL